MQLAVIGLGKIAMDQHLPAIAGAREFALAATVDRRSASAGVPHFASLEALLASQIALDAVAICTPPQVRAGLARSALEAGLAVLLEKPPAATLAEFGELTALAQARRLTLFAAWHSRFAPMVPAAREWLAARTVVAGSIAWREDVRQWHPGQQWLWQPGGLGVFDPGINALSILTTLLPAPMHVIGASLDVPANSRMPIAAQLSLAVGAARIAVELDFLETRSQVWQIRLETDRGHVLCLDDGGARLAIDGVAVPARADPEYPALYRHFATLIRTGQSDADAAPLALVADALALGTVRPVAAFIDQRLPIGLGSEP